MSDIHTGFFIGIIFVFVMNKIIEWCVNWSRNRKTKRQALTCPHGVPYRYACEECDTAYGRTDTDNGYNPSETEEEPF